MKTTSLEEKLFFAIGNGDVGVVRRLIAAGADANQRLAHNDNTPLELACCQPAIMRELIKAGADVKARMPVREHKHWLSGDTYLSGGQTALHVAAQVGNVEYIQMLIQAGAEVEAVTHGGETPLDWAAETGKAIKAVQALMGAGARDASHYRPDPKPNTHWKHWRMGGAL